MNAIETSMLTKYYGKYKGIEDVNLTVNEGEIFGFIGPNGAGKSTTIRTLLSLIYPTSGNAKIFGMDSVKETAAIKSEIGYLPSEINYYDDMKVKDLLNYSASFYKKDSKKRIKELSNIFELDLNKKIESLSFGNKKKVGIIQTLLHQPGLLILDEPTSGLDPLMQSNFFDVLKEENKRGTTIFFSSHILSEVQRMCDRVAIIKEGRILRVEKIDVLVRNRFKRVKIDFKSTDILKGFKLSGMVDARTKNKTIEFLYSGKIDELLATIGVAGVDNIWIEDPSLEEIFMHYYT